MRIRGINIINLARGCFYLFFVFVIFPVDTLIWSKDVYSSGFFNPYLSHFIYLSDLFLLMTLFLLGVAFLWGKKAVSFGRDFGKRLTKFDILLLVFVGINFDTDIVYSLRLAELFVVYFLVSRSFVSFRKLFYVFIGTIAVSAMIGVLQYFYQGSVGLNWLGEPVLNSNMLGVAKLNLFGGQVLRAYGTFSHPNIFAAYLAFAIFGVLYFLKQGDGRKFRVFFYLLLSIFGLALIFTFSRSAFLAFAVALVFYWIFSKVKLKWWCFAIIFLILMLVAVRFLIGDEVGFNDRMQFLTISKEMFFDQPLGVGIGNFTEVMQQYSSEKLMPWQFQPVHNLYLLVLNEAGIHGFLLFMAMFFYPLILLLKFLKKASKNMSEDMIVGPVLLSLWILIFVIGFFDHYFWSLYQGRLLLWMFVGTIVGFVRREFCSH